MKLLTLLILFSFLLIPATIGYGQNESNIWYFGNTAGIDFNSGSPMALSNSAMSTQEGCASICNNNGDILFYTDGSTVYNANHLVMPNGTGLFGDISSTQSAIIVKKPGSLFEYYIFTVDVGGGPNGVSYSIVDMSLQSGLGDVSVANVSIYNPSCEKITAVRHSNGVDYWIVTHEVMSNNYRSYLFSSSGLSIIPVISSVGAYLGGSGNLFTIGYLKANISGTKIATALYGIDTTQVFDFDNTNGLITNPISLPAVEPYGVEFSRNGQFLYVSGYGSLFQYDLLAGNENDINNSQFNLFTTTSYQVWALQLAPDYRIYCASNSAMIGTISNPSQSGSNCNFNLSGFNLQLPHSSNLGLPTFQNEIDMITQVYDYTICEGDSIILKPNDFYNHNWIIANAPNNVISTNDSLKVGLIVDTQYIVYDGNDTAYFNVAVTPNSHINLGPDIVLCEGDSVVLFDLNNVLGSGAVGMSYWSWDWFYNINDSLYNFTSGIFGDTIVVDTAGTFNLNASGLSCVVSDQITVSIIDESSVQIISNNPNCYGTSTGSIQLNAPGDNNSFTITDSDGNTVNNAGTNVANNLMAGWYIATVSNAAGCSIQDSVLLVDPPQIQFDLSISNPLCYEDATGSVKVSNINNFQGNIDSISYIWTPNPQQNNGLFTDSLFDLLAGEYTLEVVDDFGCVNSQIFYIQNPKPLEAIITDIKPTYCRTTATQSGNGVLAAVVPDLTNGTPPFTFEWLSLADGTTSNFSTVVMSAPGQIVLTITDANNCVYADTVLLDSINPIADFIIESDEFLFPTEYEGTELLSVKITNQSINFAQADNPLSDTIFHWNLFHNELPTSNQNWFFSYDLNEKVDTTYEGEQIYEVCLIAKNYNDCVDTTCKNVIVHAYPVLETPNVFTPGAYPNNTFFFPSAGIDEFECTVFNRYGIKVFEFNSITQEWDGNHYKSAKPCSEGVYFYVYNAMSTNGTPFTGEGQVTLIRAKQ